MRLRMRRGNCLESQRKLSQGGGGFNSLEDMHTAIAHSPQGGQLERQGQGVYILHGVLGTPVALVWPWDPDHPGYRFPGHTLLTYTLKEASRPTHRPAFGLVSHQPIFKGNHRSAPLYLVRPQPTSYSPKLGPYERPVSSLAYRSCYLLSPAQPSPTQPNRPRL
jgi:hypothetical protein